MFTICIVAFVALTRHVTVVTADETKATYDPIGSSLPPRSRYDRDVFGSSRLAPFKRREITIPEWSDDTRRCDDFQVARECKVADGYSACFECVESRTALRVCAHVDKAVTVRYGEATFKLSANSTSDLGYCVSEALANQLRELSDPDRKNSALFKARHECSSRNANWLLVRKRASQNANDSSFNFACHCKYPHLMTNVSGPTSACSRDVGCNGHGKLDPASHESRADPFVNGTCDCDPGWMSDYDDRIGPFCREGTIGEWPSALTDLHWYDVSTNKKDAFLDIYSMYVDTGFRDALLRQRSVRDSGPIRLPNPCHPCPIVSTDLGNAFFCGDKLTTEIVDGALRLTRADIGVIGNRDFLRGNGGTYPNACFTVKDSNGLKSDGFLMQFMTQEWSKTTFATEIGLLVKTSTLNDVFDRRIGFYSNRPAVLANFADSNGYVRFVNSLRAPPDNDDNTLRDYGVIWTFAHPEISQHRRTVCESLRKFWPINMYTDLTVRSRTLRSPFAYYIDQLWYNSYYYYPAGMVMDSSLPSYVLERISKYRRQKVYDCPDLRGLDAESTTDDYSLKTDKEAAHMIARSMLPI